LNRFSYFAKKGVIFLMEKLPMTLKRFNESVPFLSTAQDLLST